MLNRRSLAALLAVWVSASLTQAHGPANDPKVAEQIRAVESKLEHVIPTKAFADPMPLARFLAIVEKELPSKSAVTFRIDRKALGDRYDHVAATVIKMPPYPKQMALLNVIRLAMSQIDVPTDFRIGAGEFVITTPEDAQYTAAHDLSKAIAKPRLLGIPNIVLGLGALGSRVPNPIEPASGSKDVARLVEMIVADLDVTAEHGADFDQARFQVLNGSRLVVRTNARNHWQIAGLLAALQRLGDLSVIVQAKLYEVDDASYTKLKNAKPVDWEEQEKVFLGQIPAKPSSGPSLFDVLDKQKPIQVGDEIKLNDGSAATLIARQHAASFGPSREQGHRGAKHADGVEFWSRLGVLGGQRHSQVVLLGVTFTAGIHVTPDRRAVRLKLAEKATEIRQVKKVKIMVTNDGKEVDVEIPFTNETTHQREFEIPDGGTMLVPVHYRPKSLQEKNRWWVLSIHPRIWIEEEEKLFHEQALADILPRIVADVAKNPALKANRDLVGTPGDKRYALLDSAAWTWPKEFKADVAGFERAPAKRAGQRLLGIRIDQFQEAVKEGDPATVTVTLVNAGGSANGAVVGTCALRYTVRPTEKGWTVALSEP